MTHVPPVAAGGPRAGGVCVVVAETDDPWADALANGIKAVGFWALSRCAGGNSALDTSARAWSGYASSAIKRGLNDLHLGRATGTREGGAQPVARVCRRQGGGGGGKGQCEE